MTEALLTALSGLMTGPWWLVLAGAFLWGAASIVLSPCHLASIPLIAGYIIRNNDAGAKKNLLLTAVFSLGVFAVLAVIGLVTAGMGHIMGDLGRPLSVVLALLLAAVGLYIAGVLPLPDFGRGFSGSFFRSGYSGAFMLGLLFGAGLGPCAFAFMIPVLTVSFSLVNAAPFLAAMLLLAYILGHCVLICAAGVSAGAGSAFLSLNDSSGLIRIGRLICGLLVSAAGIYLIIKIL